MEKFYSLQGEGYNTGTAAYFIRIGGCDVSCNWCDVKESWNEAMHPLIFTDDIISDIIEKKVNNVVITGGEPLRFNLDYFSSELRKNNIRSFLETSGTAHFSGKWDWICLSPKKNFPPKDIYFEFADELKVIIQDESDFEWAENNRQKLKKECHLYLQPEWSVYNKIIDIIIEYIKLNPCWRLSLQVHRFLKIP
ncbi:MAG: 7-carboxy-7-deazaguanine synthase QueE [Bacteroidota bacterium]|nr:7-carboxy-7-deazaguanine synthase QueE [Bacteroidota bacterium]